MEKSDLIEAYRSYRNRKYLIILALLVLLAVAFTLAVSQGTVKIPLNEMFHHLFNRGAAGRFQLILWEIRIPHALAAILAGAGLAAAGVSMQGVLNNPLGSPFTLGISHAAAFGAALSVMILGGGTLFSNGTHVHISNYHLTAVMAFLFCIIEAAVVLLIARIRKTSPEVMVLAGVALGSLFSAGTMFLHYFADDTQLGAMVFWSFGDVSRANWKEVGVMAAIIPVAVLWFWNQGWNYNALALGDENAKSMGVHVAETRGLGMLVSVFITSVIISYLGIIGFVGLICPHMLRRFVGDDHRFLIPASALCGGVLLLLADTVSRLILAPHVLPVAILTSFLGAPMFVWLLVRRKK